MPRKTSALSGIKHEAALVLYHALWKDAQIARAFGVHVHTVWKWRQAHNLGPISRQKINETVARRLHAEGASDGEIARHFNVTQSGATRWRQRHGLEPNFDKSALVTDEQTRRARKLLKTGLTCQQVADEIKVHKRTVSKIRRKIKHPGLRGTGQTLITAKKMARQDPELLYRRIVKAVGRGLTPDLAEEAVQELSLDVLEGKLHPDDIERKAKLYLSRITSSYVGTFGGPLSMDRLMSDDGMSFAEVIEDESAMVDMEHALQRGFEERIAA